MFYRNTSGSPWPVGAVNVPEHIPETVIPSSVEHGAAWVTAAVLPNEVCIECREVYTRHGKRQVDRRTTVSISREDALKWAAFIIEHATDKESK